MAPAKAFAVRLAVPIVQRAALLLICAAYLQGGFTKLFYFDGALTEMHLLGLTPALPLAVATIVLEIAASAAILVGYHRWLAAVALAAFTLAATLIANRFWDAVPAEQFAMTNSFFEHLGLVGALLLVAWYDLRAATPANAVARTPMAERADH